MKDWHIVGVLMILTCALGASFESYVDIPSTGIDSVDFRVDVRNKINECEQDLPRSQKCVLEWKAVVAADLVEK